MRVAGQWAVAGIVFGLSLSQAIAANSALSAYQGAWLAMGPDCGEVFVSAGKGSAFKKPVDLFAPAFIVAGTSLRTPQASCRIKSVRQTGERQLLVLDCANSVAGHEVRVPMALRPDGSLSRFLNDRDTTGTPYQHCSR